MESLAFIMVKNKCYFCYVIKKLFLALIYLNVFFPSYCI